MPYSILELIAQNILQTLNDISTGNGYSSNIVAERWTMKNRIRDNLVVIQQLGPSKLQAPHQHLAWLQPFELIGYTEEPEGSTTPLDQRANMMWSDIVRSLREDVTRGGYAIDTIIDEPDPFEQTGPHVGIVTRITVHYRHLENDPTAQ